MKEETTWERDYKDAQKERRTKRLPIRQAEIEELGKSGHDVVKITDYQYRINKIVDLYPIHHKYHHLKTQKRGEYPVGKLKEFIEIIQRKVKV